MKKRFSMLFCLTMCTLCILCACQKANSENYATSKENTTEVSSHAVNKETAETCSAEEHLEMIDSQKQIMIESLQAHGDEMEKIALKIIAQNQDGIYSLYQTDTKCLEQKEEMTDYVQIAGTELNRLLDNSVDPNVFSFVCATLESDYFQDGCYFFSNLTDRCDMLFCRIALVYTEVVPVETKYFHPEQVAPCWYFYEQWLGY